MDDEIAEEVFDAEIIETDINDLCRICGSTSDGPLVPIYDENGLAEDLAGKIMSYLPIKLSEDDMLPIKICLNCTNGILTWHLLYECCVDADRKFQAMLSEETLQPPQAKAKESRDIPDDGDNLIEEKQEETEMEDVMFLRAEFGPEDEQYLEDETRLADGELELKCDDRQPMKRAATYENHEHSSDSSSHFGLSIALQQQDSNFEELDVENEPDTLKKEYHTMQTVNSIPCPCKQCDAVLNETDLHAHLLNNHKHNYDVFISLGKKNYKKEVEIVPDARKMIDGRQYFECSECNKLLSSSYCFKNHLRIHRNEKPYVCIFCNKAFRIYSGILRHIQSTHLEIKRFECNVCQKKFRSRENLLGHSFLHTDKRTFICDICGKGFKQKAALFLHRKLHTNIFAFKCSSCDKNFRSKTQMVQHMSVHTGKKNNTCEICGKMFRLKNDLRIHRELHSSEKSYKCTECSKAFKQRRYLLRHRKKHHSSSSAM